MRNRYLLFVLFGSLAAVLAGCTWVAEYHKFTADTQVPRISIQDAKAAYDAGEAVMVDSRAAFEWDKEHVARSINLPLGSGSLDFSKVPKGKKIIVYCSCANEHTSAILAFQMNQKEIPEVYALVGGTAAWKGAGYPMEGPAAAEPTPQNAAIPPDKPPVS